MKKLVQVSCGLGMAQLKASVEKMKSKFNRKLSPQTRKMILRGEVTQKMRAVVRFALANPEKIAVMLEEEKKLKISRWLSKEQLTAILEIDIEQIEDLAETRYVSYIEIGGKLSDSATTLTQEIEKPQMENKLP